MKRININDGGGTAENTPATENIRLATLERLKKTVLGATIVPLPCDRTIRSWFDLAKIPRLKANPASRRGGGQVYYSVAAVEKFLQSMTLQSRITPPSVSKRNKRKVAA